VGCYQGAVLPQGLSCCRPCSSVLIVRLVQSGRVWCMRVAEFGVLCALVCEFWVSWGSFLSVDDANHCLMNVIFVVVCDAQG